MMTYPWPEGEDAPHSAPAGRQAPTIRALIEQKQPVSFSNRNMKGLGCQPFGQRRTSCLDEELSASETVVARCDGDKSAW
jgi:hypothetical protein